jgi:hypothetical protein
VHLAATWASTAPIEGAKRDQAAVRDIIEEGEFVADPSLERYALTFNVGGFLNACADLTRSHRGSRSR